VLLTMTTTHEPATDLGYLLVKHPDRVHTVEVPTGTAYVCFPEASAERCTAALILEIDPVRLGGGRRRSGTAIPEGFTLGQYVNDRPYAASSLLAAALNRAFRSAMRGDSRDRPELAQTPIPLELRIPALRCRGDVERLFAPLGWSVDASAVPLDEEHPEWGESRYVDLTLTGTVRLAEALNHIYVLLPVLDDAKHYWVSPDEVTKLLRAGVGWLARHPERAFIAQRYLAHKRSLTQLALERLAEVDDAAGLDSIDADPAAGLDEDQPSQVPLGQQRRRAVLAEVAQARPAKVLDLGCGQGALLAELMKVREYTEIVGVDVSAAALGIAARRLRLERLPERQRNRVRLLQSALTYTDERLVGFDAAVLMEVIEHVDPPRLPALVESVFGHARPSTVVITTPNVEYNARYETMTPGALRHHDHRFEWTRDEFAAWCAAVGDGYGYSVRIEGIGEVDPQVGSPTQMAILAVTS
jgi:3' terminal RNA ribose 2'-O-methyltransferase Hen1